MGMLIRLRLPPMVAFVSRRFPLYAQLGPIRLLWDRWPTTAPILTRHFAGSGRYQSRCRSEAVASRSVLHRQQQRPQGVKGALRKKMFEKEARLLRIGVVGAGPISQAAHF